MSKLRELKSKRESILSIIKLTNAMVLVSTIKSKSALKKLTFFKEYYDQLKKIGLSISQNVESIKTLKNYDNSLIIIITSDRGFVGGYNLNLFHLLKDNYKKGDKLIVLGRKGENYVKNNFKNVELYEGSIFNKYNLDHLAEKIHDAYYEENMNVKIIYTKYENQISYQAKILNLLPLNDLDLFKFEDQKEQKKINFRFEPSSEEVLDRFINLFLSSTIELLFKESIVSEESSRRIAMENSTNNGKDMLIDLNLKYNKERQNKITQEIIEINSSNEAIN